MKSIYIAGPIAGVSDYETNFNAAESYLTWKNWIVLNPACLPKGLPHEKYMPICLSMIDAADAVLLLPGSAGREGAMLENKYALYQNKMVYARLEDVPNLNAESED